MRTRLQWTTAMTWIAPWGTTLWRVPTAQAGNRGPISGEWYFRSRKGVEQLKLSTDARVLVIAHCAWKRPSVL
jgi:hypothetical protein